MPSSAAEAEALQRKVLQLPPPPLGPRPAQAPGSRGRGGRGSPSSLCGARGAASGSRPARAGSPGSERSEDLWGCPGRGVFLYEVRRESTRQKRAPGYAEMVVTRPRVVIRWRGSGGRSSPLVPALVHARPVPAFPSAGSWPTNSCSAAPGIRFGPSQQLQKTRPFFNSTLGRRSKARALDPASASVIKVRPEPELSAPQHGPTCPPHHATPFQGWSPVPKFTQVHTSRPEPGWLHTHRRSHGGKVTPPPDCVAG